MDDVTEPGSKRRAGNSSAPTSPDDRGTSLEAAPTVPGTLSAGNDEPQEPAGNVVDIVSDTQPAQPLPPTTLAVLSEEITSSDGTLSSSEPVTRASEPPQEVIQSADAPMSAASSQDSTKASTSNVSEACKSSSSDEILESLLCVICQEILYKCVRSVSHTSCLYSWLPLPVSSP